MNNLMKRNAVEYDREEIKNDQARNDSFMISFLNVMAWAWLIISFIVGMVWISEYGAVSIGIGIVSQGVLICVFLLAISLIVRRLGEIISLIKKEE